MLRISASELYSGAGDRFHTMYRQPVPTFGESGPLDLEVAAVPRTRISLVG